MSTYNILFSRYKKENHPKLSQICNYMYLFLGSQERVRNSRGKRAISVRAIEVLLIFLEQIGLSKQGRPGCSMPSDLRLSCLFLQSI